MQEQSELDLSQVPRRFWTPQMVSLAQEQGQFDVAITIVNALLEDAPKDQRKELEGLAANAHKGHALMVRHARLKSVKSRLEKCLKRARAFKARSPQN